MSREMFDNLSPAAWIVCMREQWQHLSDIDLFHEIRKFTDRTGMKIDDVWRELGMKISRDRMVMCPGQYKKPCGVRFKVKWNQ